MSNDDWAAYLSGDKYARLDPADRAEADHVADLLADPSLWVEPDPELEARIHAAISSEPTPIRGPARTHRRRYALLGLAAAVLLAVGIAVPLLVRDTNHNGNPAVVFAAKLAGTALAPRASGQVTLTRTTSGWRIHLTATGLPRRATTGYYEAWLKNDEGMLVPIGTFNEPHDVTLWAGVAPSSYPTLTVTRQRADGNPASSGQVVLVGVTSRRR